MTTAAQLTGTWLPTGWGDWGSVAGIIALAIVICGTLLGSARGQLMIFTWRRLRTIGKAVKVHVLDDSVFRSPSRAWTRRLITKRYVRRRIDGEHLSVRDEFVWLAGLVGGSDRTRPPSAAEAARVPLLFMDPFDPVATARESGQTSVPEALRERYDALSEAYERYAIRTASRWYLRAVALPVVIAEVELARAVVLRLRGYGATVTRPRVTLPVAEPLLPYELPGSVAVELATPMSLPDIPRRIALAVWHRAGEHGALGYPLLTSSFEPLRYCVKESEAGTRSDGASVVLVGRPVGTTRSPALPQDRRALDAPATEESAAEMEARAEPAVAYDGVLTRLQIDPDERGGADRRLGFREEYDPLSGRQRLHLALSEVAYSAVQATNYNVFGQAPAHADVGAANLLTLNLICLDRTGVAVLVERSGRLGTHPHTFAGTVSGNAELAERQGIRADVDADGMPDLRAAVAREAMEEVGLAVDPERDHLYAVGLHTITSEYERGTHVLTMVSTLPVSAASWSPNVVANDPIEGAWEIGDHLMTLDLRLLSLSAASRGALFTWMKSEPSLATHAVGGLLAITLASSRAPWPVVLDEFVNAAIVPAAPLPNGVAVRRWRPGNCIDCAWAAAAQNQQN